MVVQDHAVIGSDGFGFAADSTGQMVKIPQIDTVVVGDDVEIGVSTAIDRPPIGSTVIGAGTKIDNLVQIGHGVELGERAIPVSQVGIAGSTTVGAGTILAGQVGVAGHLTLGKGVRATAQTGIPTRCRTRPLSLDIQPSTTGTGSRRRPSFVAFPRSASRSTNCSGGLTALEVASPSTPDVHPGRAFEARDPAPAAFVPFRWRQAHGLT